MSAEPTRSRVSLPYVIVCGVCVVAAVVTGVLLDFWTAGLLAFFGVGAIVASLVSHRATASDHERITAMQYQDERDRVLAIDGFAAVGAVALWLVFGEFVAGCLIRAAVPGEAWSGWLQQITLVQFVILALVWSRANRAATIEG